MHHYNALITVEQLHALAKEKTLILDVRHSLADFAQGRQLYTQSHLPNAHFMDIETDLSGERSGQNGRHPLPEFDALADKLRQLGMNNETQVIAYDDAGGMMAARAARDMHFIWLVHDVLRPAPKELRESDLRRACFRCKLPR